MRHGYVWSFREDLHEAKGDGFDQWLRSVKAEVWDECLEKVSYCCGCNPNNPYAKEEA